MAEPLELVLLGQAMRVHETDLVRRLLNHCIKEAQQQYFDPAVPLLSRHNASSAARGQQTSVCLAIVGDVVNLIQHSPHPDPSVDDVVAGLLGPQSPVDDATQLALQRLVFACIGCLTLLFLPGAVDSGSLLVIDVPPMKKVPALGIQSSDAAPRPFHGMLRGFGELFPLPCDQELRGETLYTSRLSFYSLHRLSRVKIKWVDVLSAHLNFNSNTNELLLFRFPSFCLFHSRRVEEETIFHCLLSGFNQNHAADDRFADKSPTQAFLNEILLSYRIIFGQDSRSRALFLSMERAKAARDDLEDPFLVQLCSKKKVDLSDMDVASTLAARTFYSVYDDFPLLGDRLLRLQKHNMQQDSSNLREFWADRRNPFNFYTFWAVIIVGGLSIILSIVQCGLSIASLVVAVRE